MHHFSARDRTVSRPEGLEGDHETRPPFHCSMILIYNIVEIFEVADDDRGLVCLVVMRDRCCMGPTLIDRDFLRQPLAANGFT